MQVPLAIVTLFHPEYWLFGAEGKVRQLWSITHHNRTREVVEAERQGIVKEGNLPISVGRYHGRDIINAGKPIDWLRLTWISNDKILPVLRSFVPRLINTAEEVGNQAGWRLEYRPDWHGRPNLLDEGSRQQALVHIGEAKHLSIRQVWLNPFATNTYDLPSLTLSETDIVANLVLGPIVRNVTRPGEVRIEQKESIWWLLYDDYTEDGK